MNYPLITEYIEAIRYASDNFDKLSSLRPVLDEEGDPVMTSGNFAVVFKMEDEQTGKLFAVKCFLKEQDGRADCYKLITEELKKVDSPYIVQVEYYDNELFVDTNQSDETEFPVLIMDWVEGQTLTSFLQDTANLYDETCDLWSEAEEDVQLFELRCIPYNFIRMASWLLKQPFAHGDIKPDNIIVKPDGTCVLVDYDGMYVPSMQGMESQCLGTPNFRYPYIKEQGFNKDLDNYAISVIALSLCAFSLKPQIISETNDYCIITEKESIRLFELDLLKDETLMSNKLFQELLSVYLHTLSQNKLESSYYDNCVAEYLCPSNYEVLSTAASDFELDHYWEDDLGVRYSLDGRKVIKASNNLKDVDYKIREGVVTICDRAFQSNDLNSISLPNSVIAIGDRSFANNDDMVYCNIPAGVRFIYENNPWGGCFGIKKMDCKSPLFQIKDGILYSSDFRTVFGFIYRHENIVIDPRTEKICANAFWSSRTKHDSFIKSITLNNVTSIGNAAFTLCKAAVIKITNKIEKLGESSFYRCTSIESIDLSSVESIPEDAFKSCDNLKEVLLSSKLKEVKARAFNGCDSLERIEFPKTTKYISESSLTHCTALKEIIVDKDNDYYCSIDGVLYNKNKTKLIKYPSAKTVSEYEIPDSVYEIGDFAIENCQSIETIDCRGIIKYYGKGNFSHCPNAKNFFIQLDSKADSESAWRLGSFLFSLKNPLEQVKKNGFDLIARAAELNHPRAQYAMAQCYKYGWNDGVDYNKYTSWLQSSASNGYIAAICMLGIEYLKGEHIAKDYRKAYELLHKIEEDGLFADFDSEGRQYAPLGLLHEKGIVVAKDLKKAVEYYKLGAILEDPLAEFNLGRCYEHGIGTEIDLQKAQEYYALAKQHNYNAVTDEIVLSDDNSGNSNNKLEIGSFTDPRDGYTYKTIKIGNKTWLAENLRYLPKIKDGFCVYGFQGHNLIEAQRMKNYKDFGALYSFDAAKEACPKSWHIPTDEEWQDLKKFLGSKNDEIINDVTLGISSHTQFIGNYGSRLIDNPSLWKEGELKQFVNNPIGFCALPSGWRTYQGRYKDLNELAAWWSSSRDKGEHNAVGDFYSYHELHFSVPGIGSGCCSKNCCLSVRCVKDD